jgi:hypothetical protein
LNAALDALDVSSGDLIVDPFAGSASAGTEVIERSGTYVGIEAHPLIAELAQLKFLRPAVSPGLTEAAEALAKRAPLGPVSGETQLVQQCFDESALAVLVGLRNELQQAGGVGPWTGHLKWALLGTLRDVASVKVGWPYQRPQVSRRAPHVNVGERFVERAQMMEHDLADASDADGCRVVSGDSTEQEAWERALRGRMAKACITSPPYLNNFDYADATRLEVYFWGYATTWAELCSEIRSEMLIATTQQTRRDVAADAIEPLASYPRIATEVGTLVGLLATERKRRPRGKEYDRVLAPYFVGVARVLSCLRSNLLPSGRCAWIVGDSAPYGVYIDTPGLIGRLAEDIGYTLEDDILLRTRGQRWRTNGTRHQVSLSERLVVFSRSDTAVRATM